MEHLVLIGAGQSAIQCITSLKKEGYTGSITLVGEEEHLPDGCVVIFAIGQVTYGLGSTKLGLRFLA